MDNTTGAADMDYIAVMLNLETSEPETTIVVEAENDLQACIQAAAYADENGYECGEIVRGK